MHLDQKPFNSLKGATRPAAFPRPKTVLIYGELRSIRTQSQCQLLKLTAHLIDTGHSVETVSPTSNPFARRIMNFRTPHKFAKSSQFLNRYDHVIIFLDSITAPQYRSINIWAKAKEHFRILTFVQQLQKSGRHAIVIGNKKQRTIARVLPLGSVVQMSPSNETAAAISEMVTGEKPIGTDLAATEHTVLEHANFGAGDAKFTPYKLSRFLQATGSVDAALIKLCKLASHPELRQTSLIKRLRAQPQTYGQNITHCAPPYPAVQMALTLDKSNNLPKYALHLLQTYFPTHNFDLQSKQGQVDALKWYHSSAREKLPEYWVPSVIPAEPDIDAPVDDSGVQQLANYLNDPKSASQFSPELQALLLEQHHKNGPTGMAILTAMLCRIELPNPNVKEPWKAKEIARWFHKSLYPLAPELQRYLSVPSRVAPSKPQIEVIGQPHQQTGLATNMRMSLQVIDKLYLCFNSRDIYNGFKLSKSTITVGAKPKRNFALHHVNAERVPSNIMTPQFAYRKDIYHIGYFLWETSKLPETHKLGTAMVNEVWAPTNFVANLYRAAGANEVTMVGKALHDLPYLAKMASITRPDPNHFTFFTAFDFHSSVERKNPIAAIKAFQRAFPASKNPHMRFVIKSTPSEANHWGDPNGQMAQIRAAAYNDPRITLIEKMLPLEYLFRLMSRADCVVSSHRGEGFGYLPAYALGLQKPTIVTNWGGVTDFCTKDTCFPVDAPLVDVPKGHAIFDAKGAKWADISPNDLAQSMLDVFHNPEMAQQRAKNGQALVQEIYSMDRLAKTYGERLTYLGLI